YFKLFVMAEHNDLGIRGEQIAVNHLEKNGYTIVEKNWRFGRAEIDIIAQKENTLAVVEVKTRTTNWFGNPQEFVTTKKKKLLIGAANEYVIKKDLDVDVRFDIIAVIINKKGTSLEHIEDAFYPF